MQKDQKARLTSLRTRVANILQRNENPIVFGHRDTGEALFNLFQEANSDVYEFKRMAINLMGVVIRHPEIHNEVEKFGDLDLSGFLKSLSIFFDDLQSSTSFPLYMDLVAMDVVGLSDESLDAIETKCNELEKEAA